MQRYKAVFVAMLCLVVIALSGCSLLEGDGDDPGTPDTGVPAAPKGDGAPSAGDDDSAASMGRVSVPFVVDMDALDAVRALESAGLKGSIKWRRDDADRRVVLQQSQASGQMLASGSYVNLIVSLGPTPTVDTPPYLIVQRLEKRVALDEFEGDAQDDGGAEDDGSGAPPDDGGNGGTNPTANDIPGQALTTSPVSGQLFVSDRSDVYNVLVNAGQSLILSVNLGTTTDQPDFQIFIYDPNAESISQDTPVVSVTSGDYPRNLTYTATTTGLFYIEVYHGAVPSDSGGDYVLTWSIGS